MGLLSGIMGTASEADLEKVEKQIGSILIEGETVERGYQLIRDLIVLTDKRIIVIDKQGVTGRKTEYMSIPYRSVVRYSIESAGTFDLDSELKLWLSSHADPLTFDFRKTGHVADIVKILTTHTCR
ncbi:PH domain-containing protein [Roseiconus nitratireducens]|uniref:PH domain-containing protein n=1 Tax=Roseiconus nitratireducens TaxID=2605748 RepID=A0A5M6D3N6_9BACT|nr:PH domain-containing protein [Roseiconus nitratireducens]KAA5542117.1 PH domain-containing protein [Roseiconus nitratireducens]